MNDRLPFLQILLASQIALYGQNRDMAKEKLNLLQFASVYMAHKLIRNGWKVYLWQGHRRGPRRSDPAFAKLNDLP